MRKIPKPRRRRTSIRNLSRKLFGRKDDTEERRTIVDFLLELNCIPKCIVTPFFKIPIRNTPLVCVREDREPTVEEIMEIERSLGLS